MRRVRNASVDHFHERNVQIVCNSWFTAVDTVSLKCMHSITDHARYSASSHGGQYAGAR